MHRPPSQTATVAPGDEQSMEAVRTGADAAAFERLVARWQEPIRRLGVRLLGDPHCADDLVQETFARVFTHRASYRPTARFSTFLFRIAINLCHDELRQRSRRTFVALDADPAAPDRSRPPLADPAADPHESALHQDEAHRVRLALLQLPELYRTVVVLRHYEDLRFQEIASVLDIPEGTVKSRMAEALDRLHDLLAEPARKPHSLISASTANANATAISATAAVAVQAANRLPT